MASGMINTTEKSRYRRIIEKHFDNEKDIDRMTAIMEEIMTDFIEEGLNNLLIKHINPKLQALPAILAELKKMNEQLEQTGNKPDGHSD